MFLHSGIIGPTGMIISDTIGRPSLMKPQTTFPKSPSQMNQTLLFSVYEVYVFCIFIWFN